MTDDLVLELRQQGEPNMSLSWTLKTFTDADQDHFVFFDEDGVGRLMLSTEDLLELTNQGEVTRR